MLRIVMAEALHARAVAARDHRPVVDRLVRPSVEEDRARARQDRYDRHVDVRDRREQQRVLRADELRHLLLDLLVQDRASEETGPRRMRAPSIQVRRHRGDDLRVEVEAEVVAGCEVEEPPVTDPDPSSILLVDHGVEHRMRTLQAIQVGDGLHPSIQPAVVLAAQRHGADLSGHDRVGCSPTGAIGLPTGEHGRTGCAFCQRHAAGIGQLGDGLYPYIGYLARDRIMGEKRSSKLRGLPGAATFAAPIRGTRARRTLRQRVGMGAPASATVS
jgi:hypothetical protein